MPRDLSGNYTLPAGNPVVDDTVIETSWANPTMADIATQFNNVITRDGLLGPTLPFKLIDGAAAAPGLAFNSAASTGMYREADRISFAWLGVRVLGLLATKAIFEVPPQYGLAPVDNNDLTNKAYVDAAVAGGFVPGVISQNPTDITASRLLVAGDFGTGILRINSASAVALTLPTVAAMGLPATPNKLRTIAFEIFGAGLPTFAGSTAATSVNGVAGPSVGLPLGGTPKRYQFLVLTQLAPGSDAWSLQ